MAEIKKELELKVEHDVTELQQSHNKAFNREGTFYLWMSKKQIFVLR